MSNKQSKRNHRWKTANKIMIRTDVIIRNNHREPILLIIDSKTGHASPISISGAYRIADELVDTAEQLEGRHV